MKVGSQVVGSEVAEMLTSNRVCRVVLKAEKVALLMMLTVEQQSRMNGTSYDQEWLRGKFGDGYKVIRVE